MALKHPEYAHGISDAELMKEALEFCDEELAGFIGMEYDSDSEVCCQRSDTFIRELVHRLSPAPETRTTPADPVSAGDAGERPCTCHPNDNPPVPCALKYAYSECVAADTDAAQSGGEGDVIEDIIERVKRYDTKLGDPRRQFTQAQMEIAIRAALKGDRV